MTTLCYGLPKWYKMDIVTPDKINNVEIKAGGITEDLIVAVCCNNGLEFVSMDCYDPHTERWEKYTRERGTQVVAWCKLDLPWSN